jgi:citrate lyase beta subunit
MAPRPRRSCLTVPASSVRMLEKAATLEADEIVVDLEDGTAAADKEAARANLVLASARGTLAVRINGVGTRWWRDDLAAVREHPPAVVVVPKAESAEAVAAVLELLPSGTGLEVQIETARGLVEVERIAALGAPLEALVFGPGDFAASIGVPTLTIGERNRHGDRHAPFDEQRVHGESLVPVPVTFYDYALARIVVAARAFGLQAVDGPYAALDDADGLRASAERALALGCDGKWVFHPAQIGPVNGVFTPSAAELERARRILAAADGASSVDGAMVDAASKRLAAGVISRGGPSAP